MEKNVQRIIKFTTLIGERTNKIVSKNNKVGMTITILTLVGVGCLGIVFFKNKKSKKNEKRLKEKENKEKELKALKIIKQLADIYQDVDEMLK